MTWERIRGAFPSALSHTASHLPSPLSAADNHFPSLLIRLLWTVHGNGILQSVVLRVRLVSLSIMFSGFIHVVTWVRVSFLSVAGWCSLLLHAPWIPLTTSRLMDIWVISYLLTVTNNAARKQECLHLAPEWVHGKLCVVLLSSAISDSLGLCGL